MAEKKSTQSKSTSEKSSSSSKSTTIFGWSLNKISFYTIGAVALFYLISAILAICGVSSLIITLLQNIGTAILICITAFLAWKYVKSKPTVWKILYFVILLIVLLGIVLPLVL